MNFSLNQWMLLVVSDIIIRATYFFLTTSNLLLTPISFALSVNHLIPLIVVSYLIGLRKLSKRAREMIIIVTANVLFVTISVIIWISFIKTGRQTACGSYPDQCYWIKG